MKKKPLLLTLILLMSVGAVVVPFRERIHFRIVSRRATLEEAGEAPGSLSSGWVHRWKVDEFDNPTHVGTWTHYYGTTRVIHHQSELNLGGHILRSSAWLPNGKLEKQSDFVTHDHRDTAPWMWSKGDQSFSTKELRGVHFWGTPLDGLDLQDADLRDADFLGTFEGTNLRGARLDGSDLDGTDLSGAVNLTVQQVLKADSWDEETKFPAGIREELVGRGLQTKGQ